MRISLAYARDSDFKSTNLIGLMEYPYAFFLTFSTYGTHLHGDRRGSVDDEHNIPGTPFLPPNQSFVNQEKESMTQPPFYLNKVQGQIVLEAIQETSKYRGWILLAVHVRTNHVHIIVQSLATPEKMMNDFKAYASRALNNHAYDNSERKRWTRHGSTRYLWNVEEVEAAMIYVIEQQGEMMAHFKWE